MFPIPLSPLDLLFFYDDRKKRPANFVIQIDFSGVVDVEVFQRAMRDAVDRNPLLRSRVARGPWRNWHWFETDKYPPIQSTPAGESFCLEGDEKIDLRREPGLRIWIRNDEVNAAVLFQFHHACTDGIGAYRFIGDLLAIYHAYITGEGAEPRLGEVDASRLPTRCQRLMDEVYQRNWFRRVGILLTEGVRVLGPPVTRLHPRPGRKPIASPVFPGVQNFDFSPEEHRQLKTAGQNLGVSVADLLVSELFETIYDWNRENRHWSWGWRKRIRLSLPTDMRDQNDFATPAANLTSIALLTRHLKKLEESRLPESLSLVESVRDEILKIRHQRPGIRNMIMFDTVAKPPFWALWLSTRAQCSYSAVISNIGDPVRRMTCGFDRDQQRIICGNLRMESITGVPPMRPHTNAAVSIFTYRRRLTISLRCDPYSFNTSDTRELLDLYTSRLRSYIEHGKKQVDN